MKKHVFPMLMLSLILIMFTGYSNLIKKGEAQFSVNGQNSLSAKFIPLEEAVNDITLIEPENLAGDEYEEAMNAAKQLLKEPIGTPPVPPDINLKCATGDAAKKLGGVYYTRLIQPEDEVSRRLLKAAQQLLLASSDEETKEKAHRATEMALRVFKRNFKKADNLIRAHKPNPDKFVAVARASLRMCTDGAQLGVETPFESYALVFGDWALKVVDKYLDEVRNNHDYRAISAVWEMSKQAQLIGVNFSTSEFLEKMRGVYIFKADFDVSCWVSTPEGQMRVMLKGNVDLKADSIFSIMGEGKGEYESYSGPHQNRRWMELPNSYSVTMRLLEFKPCEGTVKLSVDKIGAEKETWVCPELAKLGGRFTAPSKEVYLFVKTVADQLFQGNRGEGGGFSFSMPIQNLQAEMCNGNFTQTGTINTPDGNLPASITYNVTITHTSK